MANSTATRKQDFSAMHREDIAGSLAASSDRFGELAALFDAIHSQLVDFVGGDLTRALQLCALGKYAAEDFENLADVWREWVEKGGVRS